MSCSPLTPKHLPRISPDDAESRTQVLFLDPAPFIPSLRDLVSAYFALSTDAKKHVEHIYLVGGGWKTSVRLLGSYLAPARNRSPRSSGKADPFPIFPVHQLLVRIFSTSILSLKAVEKGKLVDCPTLSRLADRCGRETFTRIEIPLEVYTCVCTRTQVPKGLQCRKVKGVD